MKSGVYTITNVANGKMYVGSSARDIRERWDRHKYQLRNSIHCNSILQRSWNKHGESSFKFEIIDHYEPDMCTSAEQYWMNILDVCNRDRGYNILPVAGGSIGRVVSDETRAKLSTANSIPIIQYDLSGNIVKHWTSAVEAANSTGKCRSSIHNNVSGRSKTSSGFIWSRAEDNIELPTYNTEGRKIAVQQYNLDGELIREYESLNEARRETGIDMSSIIRVCKGRNKIAGGYVWKYSGENNYPDSTGSGKKQVIISDFDGSNEVTFNSLGEAARYLGLCNKLLSKIVRGEIVNSSKMGTKIARYK